MTVKHIALASKAPSLNGYIEVNITFMKHNVVQQLTHFVKMSCTASIVKEFNYTNSTKYNEKIHTMVLTMYYLTIIYFVKKL